MYVGSMRKSFKDSLKVLEADLQHANTLRGGKRSSNGGGRGRQWRKGAAAAEGGGSGGRRRQRRKGWQRQRRKRAGSSGGERGPAAAAAERAGSSSGRRGPAAAAEEGRHGGRREAAVCCCWKPWASDFPREYDGACVQMRMSYSPAAQFFLFFVQWSDCHLAGALGLLRILIFQVYADGTTTMSTHERKASIREFYGIIYPSLMQLQSGVTDSEERKQKKVCMERYRKREDDDYNPCSDVDIEREEECGICMEMNGKLVLPKCNHAMCSNCYNDWRTRSLSCPFCRVSLKRVESSELWVYVDHKEAIDVATITRENLKRFFMYIDKLPLVLPDSNFDTYDSHLM